MLAPLLVSLTLAATAPAAPAPPRAPEAPVRIVAVCAPAAIAEAPEAPEPPSWIARTLAQVIADAPDPEAMAAALARAPRPRIVIDGVAPEAEAFEWALPAGLPQLRETRTDTVINVPRGTALAVSNVAGTIVVRAWKRHDVRVVAVHARRDRLAPRLEAGTLTVSMVGRHGEPAFGDLTVMVPESMPMQLSSIESPIDIEGVRAAIAAGSVAGDVIVREVRGPLELNSVEGGVHVVDSRGRVRVASINNLVRLERVEGLIDAESVNGDIRLDGVESPDVDASSVNGSVVFTGPFQPRGRYRLASHRGNLRVGVPVGAKVDVSVATFNGAFQSRLPHEVVPRTGKGRRFTFTLGGGGSSLELQSFEGLIQLLRDDGPPDAPAPPAPPAPPAREDGR